MLRIRIVPEQIYFLKFILEGYDGLATVSTACSETGDIILRCPSGCLEDVRALLAALAPRLGYGGEKV